MNQFKAPIYDQMKRYADSEPVRFHVPGHKGDLLDRLDGFESIYRYDVTELEEMDDLHDPHSIIEEAQQLAATLYGADETYFLVNGSTAGNLAAVLSVCKPGDTMIVQRNVHKSVINGLNLAQAKAVFVQPAIDSETGLATAVAASDIQHALERYPESKAVLITRPNYYGMCNNIEEIVDIVHTCGIPLIVDEAHGAHLGFHPQLPSSALSAGADLVIQSTHKMLTSLTMTGMIHVQGTLVDRNVVKEKLQSIQSSSPSYILMASLDLARRTLAVNGKKQIDQFIHNFGQFMNKAGQLRSFQLNELNIKGTYQQDPFKLWIGDRTGTLNGFQLRDELRKWNCRAEMADPRYCLLAFSFRTSKEDLEQLYCALSNISERYDLPNQPIKDRTQRVIVKDSMRSNVSNRVDFSVNKREMFVEKIPLTEAAGRTSAEMVIPYPPGIPLLYPGEEITEQTIETILHWKQAGARFQNDSLEGENVMKVYR